MKTQATMTLDAWIQGQSAEALLAAEAKPDTRTPTQWLRVIRARPDFESVSRLVIVDVLRLPDAAGALRQCYGVDVNEAAIHEWAEMRQLARLAAPGAV